MDIRIIPITFILSDHGYMIVEIVIAVLSSGFMDIIVMDVIIIKTIMAVVVIVDMVVLPSCGFTFAGEIGMGLTIMTSLLRKYSR